MRRDENGVPIPETDLPWRKDDGEGICGIYRSSQYCVTTSTCFRWPDDRNYAIHAANCFPQLVAALRRIAVTPDCGCAPCRGQCESVEAKLLELESIKELANAALEAAKGGDWPGMCCPF